MVFLLAARRARMRNRSSHQRRQAEVRRDAKQPFTNRGRRVGVLQLIDVFQCAIKMTHRNIYPMLPSASEIDGRCLTRASPSTPDCKAAPLS
ncbi:MULTISPECIES: hypothetical protein [unclassified Mesorhizobium]|uniref:hypothetical protein n=1 Tax=unclassified Mesorhizobium TaxID=325217 RepID=UPI001FDFB700|nr:MULTISPECIES: hypothetical protein [unclassified Mesorhizobium]